MKKKIFALLLLIILIGLSPYITAQNNILIGIILSKKIIMYPFISHLLEKKMRFLLGNSTMGLCFFNQ